MKLGTLIAAVASGAAFAQSYTTGSRVEAYNPITGKYESATVTRAEAGRYMLHSDSSAIADWDAGSNDLRPFSGSVSGAASGAASGSSSAATPGGSANGSASGGASGSVAPGSSTVSGSAGGSGTIINGSGGAASGSVSSGSSLGGAAATP